MENTEMAVVFSMIGLFDLINVINKNGINNPVSGW